MATSRRARRERRHGSGDHTNRRRHVLLIDTNNSVPTDRRVWLHSRALVDAGYEVTVICPQAPKTKRAEVLDGVAIHRYAAQPRSGRAAGYAHDYAVCWLRTLRLALAVDRQRPVDLVEVCNPPDIYYPIAQILQRRGARFIFDQHDLSPEIFRDRFPDGSRLVARLLLMLERRTHRAADHVLTVNDSCRDLLLSRTDTTPERLTVVRTGADLERLQPREPDSSLRHGRRFLCAYLGVMGPQDNVALVLDALDVIVHELGRDDIHIALMGDGECLPALRVRAVQLGLTDYLTFTGFADDQTVSAYLSTSDLGLQPDGSTPFTNLCTMVKTIEYMAFGVPVVSFDLAETRRSAGEAAFYVKEQTPASFAGAIVRLLDDGDARARMSQIARDRGLRQLAWSSQRPLYLGVVSSLLAQAEEEGGSANDGPAAEGEDSASTADCRLDQAAYR